MVQRETFYILTVNVVILMFTIKYTHGTYNFVAVVTEDAAKVVYMIIHLM